MLFVHDALPKFTSPRLLRQTRNHSQSTEPAHKKFPSPTAHNTGSLLLDGALHLPLKTPRCKTLFKSVSTSTLGFREISFTNSCSRQNLLLAPRMNHRFTRAIPPRIILPSYYRCKIVTFLSTPTQLVCETTRSGIEDEGYLFVWSRMYNEFVLGPEVAFQFREDSTPRIAVQPLAAFPGSTIQVFIRSYTWRLDYSNPEHLEYIKIGDFRCNQEVDYDGNWATSATYANEYGWYAINCTLPDGSSGDAEFGAGVGGLMTVEVKTSLGFARAYEGSLMYLPDGTPFMMELYPLITNVAPAAGSVAGGTPLTITGSGFPLVDNVSGRGNVSDIVITVDNNDCHVLKSNFTTAICMTSAGDKLGFMAAYSAGTHRTDDSMASPSYWGFYPGERFMNSLSFLA